MRLIGQILVLLVVTTLSTATESEIKPSMPANKQVIPAPGGPIKPKAFRSFWSQFINFDNTLFSTNNPQDLPLNIVGGIFAMVDGILNSIIDPTMNSDYASSFTYEPQLNFLTYSFCQLFGGLFTPGSDGLTPCANF